MKSTYRYKTIYLTPLLVSSCLFITPFQQLNSCNGTESATYWKKRAERAPTEFVKALYLAEANKIESSRYNRTKRAQQKSKARVARIEYRKRIKLQPTFEQRFRMAIILSGGRRQSFYGSMGYYSNNYRRTSTYGFHYGRYNTRYLELPY